MFCYSKRNGREVRAIRNGLFFLALFLEVLFVLVDKSRLNNPYLSYCFRFTFILFLLVVALTRYTRQEWLVFLAFIILALVIYTRTGRNECLRETVFVFACKGIELRKAFLLWFYEMLIGCLFIVLLSLSGIFGERNVTAIFRGTEATTRYTLGFGHPNALHCMFYMLVLMGMYLYASQMKLRQYGLLLLLNFGVYFLTGSRTGISMGVISIAGSLLLRYSPQKWMYRLGQGIVLLCVLFTIAAAALSKTLWERKTMIEKIMGKINDALNGRIINLYWGTKSHAGAVVSWKLFAGRGTEVFFDMGWARMFYWYGILPGIVVLLLLYYLILKFRKKKDAQALVILVSCAIYTVFEAHLVSVYIGRNFLLLLMGGYFLQEDQGRQDR